MNQALTLFGHHVEAVKGQPIAIAFPLQQGPFESPRLFPFFRGLLPEGWFREVVYQTLKIDPKDDFGCLIQA